MPALGQRLRPQIPAVQLECAQVYVTATAAQPLKFSKAVLVAGDGLPINQARCRLERLQRLDNERKAFGPIVAVTGEKPDALGATSSQQPNATCLIS